MTRTAKPGLARFLIRNFLHAGLTARCLFWRAEKHCANDDFVPWGAA